MARSDAGLIAGHRETDVVAALLRLANRVEVLELALSWHMRPLWAKAWSVLRRAARS